jgi:hypothetical protein
MIPSIPPLVIPVPLLIVGTDPLLSLLYALLQLPLIEVPSTPKPLQISIPLL